MEITELNKTPPWDAEIGVMSVFMATDICVSV